MFVIPGEVVEIMFGEFQKGKPIGIVCNAKRVQHHSCHQQSHEHCNGECKSFHGVDVSGVEALIRENRALKQRVMLAEHMAKNLSMYIEDLEKVCAEHDIDLSEYVPTEKDTSCNESGCCRFTVNNSGDESVCNCPSCGSYCDKRPQ